MVANGTHSGSTISALSRNVQGERRYRWNGQFPLGLEQSPVPPFLSLGEGPERQLIIHGAADQSFKSGGGFLSIVVGVVQPQSGVLSANFPCDDEAKGQLSGLGCIPAYREFGQEAGQLAYQ